MKSFRIVALTLLIVVAPIVNAHHSLAMFDMTAMKLLVGTVKEFNWANPHANIVVTMTESDGKQIDWHVELLSPGVLKRSRGWTSETLRAGERIQLEIRPSRNGTPAGRLYALILANGTRLQMEGTRE